MFRLVRQARRAIQHLSPEKVRRATERPISVGLLASSASGYQDLEEFLLPSSHAADRRTDLTRLLRRVGGAEAERYDLILCEEGCDSPPGSFLFRRDQPE
ncbi:MAG: hypothetical protein FJW37_14670, partial [Acidobacteria bacterium]|nr:hypothetical protein [Acidobacteriota bacterium]